MAPARTGPHDRPAHRPSAREAMLDADEAHLGEGGTLTLDSAARADCQGENDDERIARGLKLLEPENAARMRRAQKRMLPENPAVKLAAFTERMVTGLDRPTDNLH